MEMLDRYLNAVGFWLPRRQKQDILVELADDLRAQIDEKETALRHKLGEDELAAILKNCGAPLVVASRYLPQRTVVGPVVFPVYKFLLKLILFGYLVPWALVWVGFVAFSPAYRAAHQGFALLETLRPLWLIAIHIFAFTTILFWISERLQWARKLEGWDPRKLPSVRDPLRIPVSDSLADLVFNSIFLLWWLGYPNVFSLSSALERAGIRGSWGSVWQDFMQSFYWPVATVAGLLIAISVMNLRRPHWTRERLGLRVAANGAMAGMTAYILIKHLPEVRIQMAQLSGTAIAPQAAANALVNIVVFYVLLLICVGTCAVWVKTLFRIVRWSQNTTSTHSPKSSGGAFVLFS